MGTSYPGMSSFSLATIAGEIAPVALLVAGYFALGERFDYTATYRIAFVALVLELGVTAFQIGGPAVAQACFSASNVIIMALTVTVICAGASLQRVSAAWAYSVLMLGWYAIALGVMVFDNAIGIPIWYDVAPGNALDAARLDWSGQMSKPCSASPSRRRCWTPGM